MFVNKHKSNRVRLDFRLPAPMAAAQITVKILSLILKLPIGAQAFIIGGMNGNGEGTF